ncbi:MAG: GNAT family N-acetyltransferase [Pseudomonadota bacterium]|nr:GNAT family N-acetyltransferase [Pseudomonadota bacterium]
MQRAVRNPSFAFRAARPNDTDAIVALIESAYRGDASRAGWTTEADFLEGQRTDTREIGGLIARPDARFVLAENGGRLLACCLIEQQPDGDALDCYFGMFSVCPDMQGGGLGSALLAEAERIARGQWHCRAMRMSVIDIRAELIAWYERRGYRRTGEHKPFPYGDARFGIPKRDDLRFEWLVKPLSEPRG